MRNGIRSPGRARAADRVINGTAAARDIVARQNNIESINVCRRLNWFHMAIKGGLPLRYTRKAISRGNVESRFQSIDPSRFESADVLIQIGHQRKKQASDER